MKDIDKLKASGHVQTVGDLLNALPTHYQSGKGAKEIAAMPFTYAKNAMDKLMREDPSRSREIAALRAHLDKLEAEYVAPDADNPRAVIGSNNPPADAPSEPEATTFEAITKEIDDLYAEAKTWLDGEPITTQGQAEEVGKLRDMLRAAGNRAEALRKAEAKPFDDGKAEVQGRYNPFIQKDRGKVDVAIQTAARALAPWLKKLDDDLRAEARRQRDVADQAAQDALDASRLAAASGNLDHRETAESLLDAAKDAVRDMKAAEKAKPQVAGASKAIGMKTVYRAELVDPAAAIAHYRVAQPAALKEWMLGEAARDIRVGPKPPAAIPGFKIISEVVPS